MPAWLPFGGKRPVRSRPSPKKEKKSVERIENYEASLTDPESPYSYLYPSPIEAPAQTPAPEYYRRASPTPASKAIITKEMGNLGKADPQGESE
jgi:hypothetical protein